MGTNYYYNTNICTECKRSSTTHIGKSSGGWTFSFHGMRKEWDEVRIESYKDWLDFFAKNKGEIRDEYGDLISVEDFKGLVEHKRDAKMNNTNAADCDSWRDSCWLDEEGNSFSEGEFS